MGTFVYSILLRIFLCTVMEGGFALDYMGRRQIENGNKEPTKFVIPVVRDNTLSK